jgi:hypothetical protein
MRSREYGEIVHSATPPWVAIAAESRWRLLRHLRSERRDHVRVWLLAHVKRLDAVIRAERGRRAA